MDIKLEKLKRGVSGIMRVKNDAQFIEACVESCINALDELIIVYNECSDNSPQVIEEMRCRYPEKIKVYEYKYKVYSINLTKEEYEYAKSLPEDSPHLLCNYYNFALSKVTYLYAMKIDADQIYFTEKLKLYCDAYRGLVVINKWKVILGEIIWAYSRIVNKINIYTNRILPLLPKTNSDKLWIYYQEFVLDKISKYGKPVTMSGLDVFKRDKWFVTVGKQDNMINILPPYNGVGDHLIFKMGKNTCYKKDDCKFYNTLRSDNYTLIERFVNDEGNTFNIGIMWFHVNSMRNSVRDRVDYLSKLHSNYFIPIKDFVFMDYSREIKNKIDKDMIVHCHSSIFQFCHQTNSFEVLNNLKLLESVN